MCKLPFVKECNNSNSYLCSPPSVHPSDSYLFSMSCTMNTHAPSQRIVCLNWKVSGGKPTDVANHFKTTFHLSPSFFFISLSIIFIGYAAREGPFI